MTEQMNASSASQVSNASAASDRRAELLSKADIMAILRTTTIFMTTTDEALEDVADLLRPQSLAAGQLLFARGDPGDCMYIVVKGRVRVHDGERVLNDLWAGAVVGEMAILDDAGRVAQRDDAPEYLCRQGVAFQGSLVDGAMILYRLLRQAL